MSEIRPYLTHNIIPYTQSLRALFCASTIYFIENANSQTQSRRARAAAAAAERRHISVFIAKRHQRSANGGGGGDTEQSTDTRHASAAQSAAACTTQYVSHPVLELGQLVVAWPTVDELQRVQRSSFGTHTHTH